MDRVLIPSTDFGPFKKGHMVILDDANLEQAGWIDTGYFQEITIEEPARDDESAHRAG